MRNANAVVAVGLQQFQQLIGDDSREIGKTKETVIGKDGFEAQEGADMHRLVGNAAERRVTVHNLNSFSQQNEAQQGNI